MATRMKQSVLVTYDERDMTSLSTASPAAEAVGCEDATTKDAATRCYRRLAVKTAPNYSVSVSVACAPPCLVY